MELKEGMYVRTKEGEISKIKWVTSQRWEGLEKTIEASFMLENNESLEYPRDNFKSSFNIIDLIEEGDYVNGILVERIWERINNSIFFNTMDDEIMFQITNKTMESIVTKEQFERESYKVDNI